MVLAVVGAAAMALAFALTALFPSPASAAGTVTVSTTADETQAGDGSCSLREAIRYANGTAEPDCAATPASGITTITVPAGVYVLTAGPLSLTGNAAIGGAGATATTITAAGASQVLVVASGAHATISDVAVTGGFSGSACGGPSCSLGVPVFGIPGGGIANAGTLMLARVIVTGNRTGAGDIGPQCFPPNACSGGDGGDGGGISNTGVLTIASSTIAGNSTGAGAAGAPGAPDESPGNSGHGGNGGGISNSANGTLTITNSTIAGNTTSAGPDGADGLVVPGDPDGGNASDGGDGGSGGGIENSGRLVIAATTLDGNRTGTGGKGGTGANGSGTGHGGIGGFGGAGGSGGAIDGTTDMTISNSTIAANAAAAGGAPGADGGPSNGLPPTRGPAPPGNGGGIEQRAMGTTLSHVTVASNTAAGNGGGIDGNGGTVTVGNSIVTSNLGAAPKQNCAGVLTDQGGNLEFGASSCPGGFLRADPRLAALADNGGPTQTIALQPGSAAIHHVRTCVLSTDQRGVARPVGAPCDSGAYQVARPSLSGVAATTITTTSATIAASVNPNLKDSTVVINYGRTQSYGSSTPPRDLGAGNTAAGFTAALTGLQPNTTYHFDVAATNADGRTTTSDGVFRTQPPLTASVSRASTTGSVLSLTIACAGGSGPGTCRGPIRLSAEDPSKHRANHKHRGRRELTVAAGGYSVSSGHRANVKLRLNRKGQTMLSRHYTLVSTMSLRGTTQASRRVTFRYRLIRSPISYTFAFAGASSVPNELTVSHIARGGKVTVICHGGGCPFGKRTFAPRHGRLILAPAFHHRPLRPGANLVLEVIAANRVGEVEKFTIRAGRPPIVTKECLPPGTKGPARCV